jgi:hypothetical protein
VGVERGRVGTGALSGPVDHEGCADSPLFELHQYLTEKDSHSKYHMSVRFPIARNRKFIQQLSNTDLYQLTCPSN